jgi:hypothetical protein
VVRHLMIESYLDSLRLRLGWHRNSHDIVAELEDHLYSTAESLERSGLQPESAQRETLRRVGDPRLVAVELATTSRGTLAVPTRFTKNIGIIFIVGALAWTGSVIAWWIAALIGQPTGVHMVWTESTPGYEVFQAATAMFMVATISLLVTMAGLHKRHGGLAILGWAGMILVFYAVQTATIFESPAMAFQAWGTFTTIGTLLFGLALYRRDLVPRKHVVAFSAGGLVGTAIWVTLRLLAGPHREWGGLLAQYWTINLSAVTIGVLLLAVGMFRLGLWLHREQPADILGRAETVLT